MIRADRLSAVTWQCLHFGDTAEAKVALQELDPGFTRTIDGAELGADRDVFVALASEFEFPDYFGHNWDAVHECLRELDEWLPANGYALVIANSDALWRSTPSVAANLVESWLFCVGDWASRRIPFHLVFTW